MKSCPHGPFSWLASNAWFLLTLAPLLWGGNAVAGKLAAGQWPPFTLTLARWVAAFLILLPFAMKPLRREWPQVKSRIPYVLLLGAVGMACFNMLMYLALNYTTAINTSIIQSSMPVFIMLANFLILSERAAVVQIVGLALAILGVMITTTAGDPVSFFTGGLNIGDGLMLLASVFYAAYGFGLRWKPEMHWLSFMLVISLSALLTSLPFAARELMAAGEMPIIDTTGWLVLGYIVLFPTMVSQIAFARGVELVGSNRAGLFINFVPIFGSLLAILIVGEAFRWYHGLGLVLVLGGIMMSERARLPGR
ncbi:MAG: EamA family transporter [Gammaproteobacteria bacterium]|nr:MAG: EamA family transporter [Gammaproteobacteria bacterium]